MLILSYSLCCFLLIFKLASKSWEILSEPQKKWVISLYSPAGYFVKAIAELSETVNGCIISNTWASIVYQYQYVISDFSFRSTFISWSWRFSQRNCRLSNQKPEKTFTRALTTNCRNQMHVIDDSSIFPNAFLSYMCKTSNLYSKYKHETWSQVPTNTNRRFSFKRIEYEQSKKKK